MRIDASFLKRNEQYQKTYGHITEGVKHFSNDPRLNELEENKMAVMIANATENFCMEKGLSDYKALKEATTLSTDASTFVRIQMPLIRKVYPSMISREFVSVQPMSQPTTMLFYYDIVRGADGSSLSQEIHDQRTYADNEEYNPSDPMAIKDISLKITSSSVSATTKKLKERHTVESEQDIMAYHGISVEADLVNALSAEIAREWDRVIIQAMLDGATGGASTFDMSVPAGITYGDRKYWMETLYEKMIDIDTQIYKKRYRKTNFCIASADIASFIEKMAGFRADDTSVDQKVISTGGRYFMGTLNSRWRIYVDPFMASTKMLMGYNNPGNWLETSVVWAPYILSYFSDSFLNPDTFVKTRAILSRSCVKVCVPDLLGVLTTTSS